MNKLFDGAKYIELQDNAPVVDPSKSYNKYQMGVIEAHKKMILALDDPENKNLHDVTAYLATLK